MHPVARAELHLHALDENARIVSVGLEKQGISLDKSMRVLSFEVPDNHDRRKAKTSLISALAKQNLLSDIYFGPVADLSFSVLSVELEDWVSDVVQAIKISDTV